MELIKGLLNMFPDGVTNVQLLGTITQHFGNFYAVNENVCNLTAGETDMRGRGHIRQQILPILAATIQKRGLNINLALLRHRQIELL